MKKHITWIAGFLFFSLAGVAVAAPNYIFQRTIIPETDSTYELGTTTKAWLKGYFDEICLTASTCRTTWPAGGAGSQTPWEQNINGATYSLQSVGSITATSSLITQATSTNLAITGITSSLLKTNGSGAVVPAVAGTDYVASTFSYPFPNNATTSTLTLGGLSVTGIANFNGLTNNGGATTTSLTVTDLGGYGLVLSNAVPAGHLTLTATSTLYSNLSAGGMYIGANGQVLSGATTTFSTGLTYSNGNVVCDTASASIFGCLSSAYFTVFNNKVSSSSLFAYPFPNNATTSSLTLGGLTLTSFSGGLGANPNTGLVYGAPTTTFSGGLTYSNGNVTSDLGTSIDISAETNLSATYPVILTGDVLSFPATSTLYSNLSAGGLYIGADKTVLSAATTTFTGTSPITATHASGVVTIACASCSVFTYPFTSATTYTGVSTSTLINFAGGVMSTASSTLQNLYSASTTLSDKTLLTNATSTNLYVGTQFFAPITRQFIVASSSLGTGTTTYKFSGFSQGATVLRIGCNSVGGGVFNAQFGDSAASSTMVQSSTGLTTTFTTVSTNNTYTTGETVWASIGGVSGTVSNPSCTLEIR